ncbi:MAG: S41 family peptidase [Dehalococcoidia bacterium]|nr:S41 family peptidase [Dehalococcoidia bacterium]MDP6227409.1 S41 family peptidase [Dehalococcoidia bacterium]MDP7084212.1 S41 family peptidase [Dehalococcoidia bacterium]MDP7201864.1 S41 family peptidase [Dehalococcoidia bacterium]MDP7510643.1 S41 family peptidase [Dehalococcoidia bacterium]
MTKFRPQWALLVLVMSLGVLLVAAACRGGESGPATEPDPAVEGLPTEFDRMAEVWKLLAREHIDGDSLDAEDLSDGAIRGMLDALDDPYAAYLTSDQFAVDSQDIKGYFEGIGAEVGMRDGRITILAPMPDTPAEEAGIRPGDIILEIEGESTKGISIMEAVSKIRGEKGTDVMLLVLHINASQPDLLRITRGKIPLESARLLMQVGQIGHLRVFSFTGTTKDEIKKALERFERSKGVGLVLDLRNNPGGLLTSVVDVTSQFLDDGLVLYQIDAQGKRTDWDVKSGGEALDVPLVVLVNEFSASASEVLTGAFMDHGRATVIGTTTFGKGSVNNMWPLSDGSGINFTIARWFTPEGTVIEGEGISPDIIEERGEDDSEDVQLDRAIEVLKEQIAQGG